MCICSRCCMKFKIFWRVCHSICLIVRLYISFKQNQSTPTNIYILRWQHLAEALVQCNLQTCFVVSIKNKFSCQYRLGSKNTINIVSTAIENILKTTFNFDHHYKWCLNLIHSCMCKDSNTSIFFHWLKYYDPLCCAFSQ